MKRTTRWFTLLLACTAARAFALTDTVDGVTWTYAVSNGKAIVGGGTGSAYGPAAVPANTTGAIAIPSSLGSYPVTEIGNEAFENRTGLTAVAIPDGVWRIGVAAFLGCDGLTSVEIPDSVTAIPSAAFAMCAGLTQFVVGPSNSSFSSVNGLLLSKDGTKLLYGVNGNVTVPESVTTIEDYAFSGRSGLTTISIPDGVSNIGGYAITGHSFYYCSGIETFSVGAWNSTFSSANGLLLSKDGTTLWSGVNGSVTIPSCVTNIKSYAFSGRSGLTSVTIPYGVKDIGYEAFIGCSGLTSIQIPDSVTNLGDDAFRDCSGLTSITIPGSVTDIGDNAFRDCSGLISIRIPDSVTSIGSYAFYGCSSLQTLYLPESFRGNTGSLGIPSGCTVVFRSNNDTEWNYRIVGSCAVLGSGTDAATAVPTNTTGALVISDTFGGCPVTDVGDYAFYKCEGLTSVAIPAGVTNIGNVAFANCSGLISITIPDSVTSIGEGAFGNCSALASITIPDGVTDIGAGAFVNCSGLPSIAVPSGVTAVGAYAFAGCSGLESITIPDGVTAVGAYAFAGCSGLESITIPSGVTNIGESAFADCSGLQELSLPEAFRNAAEELGIPSGCAVEFRSDDPPAVATYTVKFDANGGTGTMAAQTFTKDVAAKLSANKFAKNGNTFAGWATTKDGAVAYADGALVKNLAAPGQTVTLYAQWKTNATQTPETPTAAPVVATYTVTFDANGGTGTMAVQTFTKDVAAKLSANKFAKNGNTFAGWATTKDGAVAYADGASVKNLAAPGQTVTLYAQWKTNATQTPETPTTAPVVTTYTVKFAANGGTGKTTAQKMTVGKSAKLRKNAFTRKGWVFLGWSKTKTGAVAFKNAQSVKNLAKAGKTVTLYAQWAKKSYKVAFYANGGTGTMTAQTMTYGKSAKLKDNKFKRKGYVFKGWAKSKALAKKGTVAYKNKKKVKNLIATGKTVKLYAVWKKK